MRFYAPFSVNDAPQDVRQRINSIEPFLNALVTTPQPAAGLTVAVKDIIHVDGLATLGGSKVPVEPAPQASAVTKLQQAGWSVLAKTATTEFACFEPTSTTNPRDTGHTPGGSSSGSAAAVAAGYCVAALGTQTIGSVIRPGAFCGIASFKPSYGSVPIDGVLHVSPSLDTLGWFAADVAGLVAVADALLPGVSPAQVTSDPILGIPEGPYLDQAIEVRLPPFAKRVRAFDDITRINHLHRELMLSELAEVHRASYSRFAHLYRPATRRGIERGCAVDEATADIARDDRMALRAKLIQLMDDNNLDAWIAPAAVGRAPRGIRSTGDPAMNLPWTYAGLPVIGVPIPRSGDLALGVQIICRDEAAIMGIASWIEHNCDW